MVGWNCLELLSLSFDDRLHLHVTVVVVVAAAVIEGATGAGEVVGHLEIVRRAAQLSTIELVVVAVDRLQRLVKPSRIVGREALEQIVGIVVVLTQRLIMLR